MEIKPRSVVLWAMLVALAASNALLIRQNLQMRRALDKFKPDSLQAGDAVPPFVTQDLQGNTVNINYTGEERKRVFLFFTPSCPYCREQFAYWRELLQRVDNRRFEVLGLAADAENKEKLEEYLRSVGCPTDVPDALRVVLAPNGVRRNYKLSATPITLVVANDGRIEQVWDGRWDERAASAASATFGVKFTARFSRSGIPSKVARLGIKKPQAACLHS